VCVLGWGGIGTNGGRGGKRVKGGAAGGGRPGEQGLGSSVGIFGDFPPPPPPHAQLGALARAAAPADCHGGVPALADLRDFYHMRQKLCLVIQHRRPQT